MGEVISQVVMAYLEIGFTAIFSLTVLGIAVWYFVFGRKEAAAERLRKDKLYNERYAIEHEDRQAVAIEIARSGKIIENCTAVINNNSKVIEESCTIRKIEIAKLDAIIADLGKHETTLETLARNQFTYMERQKVELDLISKK